MNIKRYLFSIFVLLIIVSCNQDQKLISKLDKESGFQDLIVGDSTYSRFMKEIRNKSSDSEIIEREIFGKTVVPSKKLENLDHRFIYGVLMDGLYGGAINGKVYFYSLVNNDADSLSNISLLDSLKNNYGTPTASKDTTYTILDTLRFNSHKEIWKGNKVKMIYEKGKQGDRDFLRLEIVDISAEKELRMIENRIESLTKNPSKKLAELEHVGELSLYTTKQELLQKGVLETKREKLLEDYEITNYGVSYDKYLKPFFGIDNRKKYQYGDSRIVSTDLEFFGKTDSLNELSVSFDKEIRGSYGSSIEVVSYSDLISILGKKFGEYTFEEKLRMKEGIFRRSFWLSDDLIIEVEDQGYYDEVIVTFYINKKPYSLYL